MMKTGTLEGVDGAVPVVWLSKREGRLLRLMVDGKSPKEIAALLFLAPNTVRGHQADLGREVGAAESPPRSPLSPAELMVWALRNNALRAGPVILRDHPPNCSCVSAYCRAMFVAA